MKDMDIVFPGVCHNILQLKWFGHSTLSKSGGFWRFSENGLICQCQKPSFCSLFSKCCHLEHNEDNHLKPTPNVNYFPKFLWEEKSLLISLAAFELLKFEKWPQVVLRNHNFGEESSPVLSYSTDEAKTKMFFQKNKNLLPANCFRVVSIESREG